MQNRTTEPADTRMMGIVHSALRRDLERCRLVLSTAPYPAPGRRHALASHLLWLMGFLNDHHTAEDNGLWPAVLVKNPAAAEMLEQMEADHAGISPAASRLEEAVSVYRTDPGGREAVLTALADLGKVLLPHLAREEVEMMPVVAVSLTEAERFAIEKRDNIDPKGFAQLGDEGHWILDGLDDEGREVVLRTVSAVPRFLLLHLFGRRYQRKVRALWGGTAALGVPSLPVSPSERARLSQRPE